MKVTKVKVEEMIANLKRGDVLLTGVRKVHNTDKDAPEGAFKVNVECREWIDNEFRPVNAAGLFNKGDSRFVGNTPRAGFATMEPAQYEKYFGQHISIAEVEALEFSSREDGLTGPDKFVEGKHILYIGLLNPSIQESGQNYKLHVFIQETTVQRNPNQPAKLNPVNGEVQSINTKPIYVNSTIENEKKQSIFLLSDQMRQAIADGRLPVAESVMQKYGITRTAEGVVAFSTGPQVNQSASQPAILERDTTTV